MYVRTYMFTDDVFAHTVADTKETDLHPDPSGFSTVAVASSTYHPQWLSPKHASLLYFLKFPPLGHPWISWDTPFSM